MKRILPKEKRNVIESSIFSNLNSTHLHLLQPSHFHVMIIFRLLAVGGGLSQTQPLITVKMTPSTPRMFGQRERSISAPNVNLISTTSTKASPQVPLSLDLHFKMAGSKPYQKFLSFQFLWSILLRSLHISLFNLFTKNSDYFIPSPSGILKLMSGGQRKSEKVD